MIRQYPYNVIITDLRLPGLTGEVILEEALALFPKRSSILMTGFGKIPSRRWRRMRKAPYDYLPVNHFSSRNW